MHARLPKHEVVLLGIGHTNAHVLRMWRMHPLRDARLTCVSNFPVVTYSGMLPGVLAGNYEREAMEIDLVRLCAASGARLIVDDVVGLDRENHRLLFAHRASIPFDLISIGIGSVPSMAEVEIASDRVLPIKPMQTFLDRLRSRIEAARQVPGQKVSVVVVGAGAGGAEIAFCLDRRLQTWLDKKPYSITVIHAGDDVINGVTDRTSEVAEVELRRRGIELLLSRRVRSVRDDQVELDDGQKIRADAVLWSTGATAAPLLAKLPLTKDPRGFILTNSYLQSVDDPAIFAVGDTGTVEGSDFPKAGVYAVREGPVLWDNFGRTLAGDSLVKFRPQKNFLKLFNLGDGRALGQYQGWTYLGRLAWRLKDRIDRRFMEMYQDYEPAMMEPDTSDEPPPMRCAGCGGKVGGSVLSRVLARLEIPSHPNVLLGLDHPDDAAILQFPAGKPVNATVDFFTAPLEDPYLVGRLAALNSASDSFAMGAKPVAGLAAITLPWGRPAQQEQMMYEVLEGALREFRTMGATLAGGHTIEGAQLTVGFTVLAEQGDPPLTKSGLRVGDQLVLTKPLGTGVLLAALMRARCRADWYRPMLDTMLASNQFAASLSADFDIRGLTDVTGFGFAGHLLEMLRASGRAAVIELSKIPLLPGAATLVRAGLESTLAPANRLIEVEIEVSPAARREPAYGLLFDPQTCGGLLLGVPEQHVDRLIDRLRPLNAARVGQVTAESTEHARLRCVE